MLTIVNIAGQQFKVSKDQRFFVHQLEANAGDSVSFDQVLMTISDSGTTVGTSSRSGASVATVLGHQKGDKVIVFKKKEKDTARKTVTVRVY